MMSGKSMTIPSFALFVLLPLGRRALVEVGETSGLSG
jgi:hypothetical protein